MTYWSRGTRGAVPCNAVQAGRDADGGEIYVGRAQHAGDLLPGKVVPNKGGAFVAYGGSEHSKFDYEVLCGGRVAWQPGTGSRVPPKAVPGGSTSAGERLYIGRVLHQNTVTCGKVHPSHAKCYIPYGGRELGFDTYEILINI